ncbi:anti-sigma factor RsbA family regulatory protein [Streptomyces sp. NPDC055060]
MSAVSQTDPFVHPALFYRGEREYLAGTVPFVRDGLASDEAVAVAVPGARLELLRAALGSQAAQVRLIDMAEAGRNPGRIIPRVLRAFADAHPTGRVRIIGEPIWAGRTEAEYPACAQHEALINLAFRGREATILCPYDTDGLDETVLADARATHPTVIESGRSDTSGSYAPETVISRYNLSLTAPDDAWSSDYKKGTLAPARQGATRRAADLGLSASRQDDFALAVAELTTNSVLHGGGFGTLRIWSQDSHIVCEVRDTGHLADPLAGRRPPAPNQLGGRGLLLVHTVADLVRVHSTARQGTTIHCFFRH